MEHFDNLGNIITEGDIVLVLVPHSDSTWRKAYVRGFKDEHNKYCNVQVEYINDRLYSNMAHYYMTNKDGEVPGIKFTEKITKAWRHNSEVVAFKDKYFD